MPTQSLSVTRHLPAVEWRKKQLTSLFHRSDQKQQKLPKDRFQSFTLIDGETLKTIRQASSNINIFFLSRQLRV